MRVAVYNQMFGLNGRKFWSTVVGHYYVHYQKDSRKVSSRVNLSETLKTVEKANADIIGICEIFEGHESKIIAGLKKMGYRYFYFGKGHKFKFSRRHVLELIASKIKGKQLNFRQWPMENKLGGGGGFVACKFPGINIIHVHMAIPARNSFYPQITHLKKIAKKMKGKTVLMGDFNYPHKRLEMHFSDYTLVTRKIKTCSLTPVIKWVYNKDIDHIFIKGFKTRSIGTLEGKSDHRLVYAELK